MNLSVLRKSTLLFLILVGVLGVRSAKAQEVGSWTNTTALPSGLYSHSAVAYNGYIYTTGGANPPFSSVTSTIYYAHINTNRSVGTWSTTTALPRGLLDHSAVAYNGYIYTVGGSNPPLYNVTSTVYFAPINPDGSIGIWSTTTALPRGINDHSAVVYNGYIYTTGGVSMIDINGTSTVYYAPINGNGSIGAWGTTTALPNGIHDHSTVVYNGYIYTIGGKNPPSSGATSTVYYAPINGNGSIGAWAATTVLPRILDNHATVANNGYIYITGGESPAGGTPTSTVYYAPINGNGSIGTWAATTALPGGIQDHSAVVYRGYVYTTGGGVSLGPPTSTVSYAPINTPLFLRDSVSDINPGADEERALSLARGAASVSYTKNVTPGPVTPPTAATQFTKVGGFANEIWYSKPLNAVTISGPVTFNLRAAESASTVNSTVTAELLRTNGSGTIISTISSVLLDRAELTTIDSVQNWILPPTATTLASGDRLAVRVYVDDGSGVTMASGVVTMTVDGSAAGAAGDSYVKLTEGVSELGGEIPVVPRNPAGVFQFKNNKAIIKAGNFQIKR